MPALGGSIVAASYRMERMSCLALGAVGLIVSGDERCSDAGEAVLMGKVTMAGLYRFGGIWLCMDGGSRCEYDQAVIGVQK